MCPARPAQSFRLLVMNSYIYKTDYDPEEIQSHTADVDNEMQVDTSAAREHYLDMG